jgi:hypothetical protein
MDICDGCRALAWASLDAELLGQSLTRWQACKALASNSLVENSVPVVPTVSGMLTRLRALRDGLPGASSNLARASVQVLVNEFADKQDLGHEHFPTPDQRA